MSQQELLIQVVGVLDAAGIDYMLTGSVASSLYGEPRSTHDIDLVVMIPPGSIAALVQAFPAPGFYLDEESVREAVRSRDMFNLLSVDTGDKVDFWLVTDEPFDQSRFARRIPQPFNGEVLQVSTPEDLILAKLRWARLAGGSEKQYGDALRVYEVQFERLDHQYLDRWAAHLGVTELLERVRQQADRV